MNRQWILALALSGTLSMLAHPVEAGRGGGGGQWVPSLTSMEQADLVFMRQEEKLARDIYLHSEERYAIPPFANIAASEQRHMDAMLQLLQRYRVSDPVAGSPIGQFADSSLQALHDNLLALGDNSALTALKVGGFIEEADMRDIVAAIDRSEHADIDRVYGNLLCGSRNHLRAFAGQIVLATGLPYSAQLLPQTEVDAILSTPQERCGN